MGIGWGIVGYGWVARDFMAPAIRAAGDSLVAVADPDPAARHAAEAAGARAHPDVAGLLADPAVAAVYVATPNHLHADAVVAAAAAGKAVLCEKPMAAVLAEAERMEAACRRAGILYGTAFDQRHHPAHLAMRDAVRAGAVGRPTAIRIVYACWVGADWTDGSGRENWRVDAAKAGGGALIDLAPHGLDLVDFLLGEPLAGVTALTQRRVQDYAVDDGAILVGATASGVLATLHVAYNCPEALPRRRLEIVGSEGMLVAENTMGQDPGGTLLRLDGRTGAATPIPFAATSPFAGQVRAFGTALRSGDRSAFSAERDLGTMRLLHAAYASAAGTFHADALPTPFRGGVGCGGPSADSPAVPPAPPSPRPDAARPLGHSRKGEGTRAPAGASS